ncbi:MAG TPA: serine hydrolase domain-containing protein [Chloroflexota bacterium]|nr:serine hydrolase domain-containing protein [Chloroflexota bacterium]
MSKLQPNLLHDAVDYADRWVAHQQDWKDLPGVVVAIRHEDQLLLAKGYGHADLERHIPMTPGHIFRVASHSKTFTATAIMQLVERGALRLDDRLADSIPWLRDKAGLSDVTIRQVLNHSAGIVRDGIDADHWQLDHPFPDHDALRRLAEDGGRVLNPNEGFKYSNIGYGLLGLVIEAAGGMSYHEYVKRHIIQPLGLTDTGPELDAHAEARLATGYTVRRYGRPRRPLPHVTTGALASATGFYSTAEDLCRYAAAHFLGDDTLLSDASKREMQQPYWKAEQTDQSYGLGFIVCDLGGRRLIGHSGGFPGFITQTLFDPRERLVVTVLTNDSSAAAGLLMRGIMSVIEFAHAPRNGPDQGFADLRERFTGRFANEGGVFDVALFGDTLVALSPDADNPVQVTDTLAVEDERTLRITDAPGFGSRGEAVHYTRDAEGKITKVVAGGITSYPLEIFLRRPVGG